MDLPESRQYKILLFDFYDALLTERQREIFIMHHIDDLSLVEIGELKGITPQAVSDMLKRTENHLHRYEEHLMIVAKYESRKITAKKINKALDGLEKTPENKAVISKVQNLMEIDFLDM